MDRPWFGRRREMEMHEESRTFLFWYKKALRDGLLLDVTLQARRLGFQINIAISETLFLDYLVPNVGGTTESQSLDARLGELLLQSLRATSCFTKAPRVEFGWISLRSERECDIVRVVALGGRDEEERMTVVLVLPEDEAWLHSLQVCQATAR